MRTYFKGIDNLEDLRKEYRKLAKKLHPDCGGNEAEFKAMSDEYEKVFAELERAGRKTATNKEAHEKKYDAGLDQEIRDIINKIIHLNIDIEVCGSWIWCSGNTYTCKDELKANGFKWCSNKKMWAWHPADYVKKSRKSVSMNDIRNLYGSETIKESKKDDTKKLR